MATKAPTALERIQGFQQQIQDTLAEVKTQLARQLQAAADTYKEIIAIDKGDLWKDAQYEQALSELALMPKSQYELQLAPKSTKAAATGKRIRLDPEAILAFVIAEKQTSSKAVSEKFGCSKIAAMQNLDKLAEAKKIQRVKEDPSKKLSPVTYKAIK
jgi:DNA-binding GntR family transcriptional regulator